MSAAQSQPDVTRSLDDLKQWMQANGADAIVGGLRPGADEQRLEQIEKLLGRRFPPTLRQLYLLHDGQQDREALPFFGIDYVFADLEYGLQLISGMVYAYFGVQQPAPNRFWAPGNPKPAIKQSDFHRRVVAACGMQPEEETEGWWPLAAGGSSSYIAVNLDTGRVFFAEKDSPPLRLAGAGVGEFLAGYARAVRSGEYEVEHDEVLGVHLMR